MPTKNDKSKTSGSANTKNSANKSSKSGVGLANSMPSSRATDKAKAMDNKRRGDAETFKL